MRKLNFIKKLTNEETNTNQKNFIKNDLKNDMVVEFKNGTKSIVGRTLGLERIGSDLLCRDDENYDIVQVYELKPITERREYPIKMSLEQIEKELGYKIELINF